jgi:Uma2 family endonuclease
MKDKNMVDYPLNQDNLITVDEYIRIYSKQEPLEIIDGEMSYLMPMVAGQGMAAQEIDRALSEWESVGHVFFRLPYVLLDQKGFIQNARLTEVQFIRNERLVEYKRTTPNWPDLPMMIVPDIAVNVLPYDGKIVEIDRKFDHYLQDGVETVWVVDPKQKTVTVRGQGSYQKLKIGETLTGGDVIPEFELAVEKIFE